MRPLAYNGISLNARIARMGARHGDVISLGCFWIKKASKGYRKGHRRKWRALSTASFADDSGR